jgi:hypothetical protein
MRKTLKEKNQPQLIAFVLVNAIVLGVLLVGLKHTALLLDQLTKGNIATLGRLIAVPSALALVIGIISWAVPRGWKEVLIFWRMMEKNCLPSNRAFTVFALNDPRVDRRRLAEKCGPLPSDPAEQTRLWYNLYQKNADHPAVEDAHCAYLRYREMTALVASIVTVFVLVSIWIHPSLRTLMFGVGLIAAEYLLLLLAARNAANHFVTNVLAIESAGAEVRSMLV